MRTGSIQIHRLRLLSFVFLLAPIPAIATERVNVSETGDQSNSLLSIGNSLAHDGRFVAFRCDANNLVPGSQFAQGNIYVRDRQTNQLTRITFSTTGGEVTGASFSPVISSDGRYVAFQSSAGNLVSGDTNGNTTDIFRHDRDTGQTTLVSVNSSGQQAIFGASTLAAISGDGRFVAFVSDSSQLVSNDNNNNRDTFLHDTQTGLTVALSVTPAGPTSNGRSDYAASLSFDGRYVVFVSTGTNLLPSGGTTADDVFLYDRIAGTLSCPTGQFSGGSGTGAKRPSISTDGRYLAFDDNYSGYVAGDTNGAQDVFVYDAQTGQTERVSVDSSGVQGNGASLFASISADGRYVSFQSDATNLVADDNNGQTDIFVHDRQTGATTIVSRSDTGALGDGASGSAAISGDGQHVAYYSAATNLVDDDTNGFWDIFVSAVVPTQAANPPLQWPVADPIVTQYYASYGEVVAGEYHTGMDMVSNSVDMTVRAAAGGTARIIPLGTYANQNHNMGNIVIIEHTLADGAHSLYAHLGTITVADGATVSAGDPIGTIGATGLDDPDAAHLHFEFKPWGVIGNLHDDTGPKWGYTPDHPNLSGYMNPDVYLSYAVEEIEPIAVATMGMTDVKTGPDPTVYTQVVTTTSDQQQFAAFCRFGAWYNVYLPSDLGPASGWIQATPAEQTALLRVDDPVNREIGVNLRDSATSSGDVVSKVWDAQRLAITASSLSGNGCTKTWRQTDCATNTGASQGWLCAQYLSGNNQTGDIDGDGEVDGGDVAALQTVLVHPASATPDEFDAADVNDDGRVDGIDIQGLVSLLLTS